MPDPGPGLTPLTPAELDEWAEYGIPADDAHRWWTTLHQLCGPPTVETWHLASDDEPPSTCALSWATYWLDTFGADDYDDVAPWLPHFPAPVGGAEAAADYRDSGWDNSGNPPDIAGRFYKGNIHPVVALRWHTAGFDPEPAARFIYAGISIEEAQANPEAADMLAGLNGAPEPEHERGYIGDPS